MITNNIANCTRLVKISYKARLTYLNNLTGKYVENVMHNIEHTIDVSSNHTISFKAEEVTEIDKEFSKEKS